MLHSLDRGKNKVDDRESTICRSCTSKSVDIVKLNSKYTLDNPGLCGGSGTSRKDPEGMRKVRAEVNDDAKMEQFYTARDIPPKHRSVEQKAICSEIRAIYNKINREYRKQNSVPMGNPNWIGQPAQAHQNTASSSSHENTSQSNDEAQPQGESSRTHHRQSSESDGNNPPPQGTRILPSDSWYHSHEFKQRRKKYWSESD